MQAILEKTETREWVTMENSGQLIFGVLHRPIRCENPPLVFLLHGFASSKHGSRRSHVYLAEALAQANIATLRFDFRGSGDSEGKLSEINFNDLVSDAVVVFKQAASIERIDLKRVGIFGSSLGGAIAILASALHQEPKTLVLWAPVASGELWYRDKVKQNPELINTDISEAFSSYAGETINSQFREQFGLMHAAKTLGKMDDLPVLHMNGKEDSIVSLSHQQEFRKYCSSHCHFITYPETEHVLSYNSVLPEVIQESVTWFKKHL